MNIHWLTVTQYDFAAVWCLFLIIVGGRSVTKFILNRFFK